SSRGGVGVSLLFWRGIFRARRAAPLLRFPFMDLTRRIDRPELMDTTTLALPEMKKTLERLGLINRLFGGVSPVLRYLKNQSTRWRDDEIIHILDVGTGGAEIPVAIARWA